MNEFLDGASSSKYNDQRLRIAVESSYCHKIDTRGSKDSGNMSKKQGAMINRSNTLDRKLSLWLPFVLENFGANNLGRIANITAPNRYRKVKDT